MPILSADPRPHGSDGHIWPNFLIIGAPKSGTTSLYHYLSQHPDVFLSPVRKEGRFFSGVGRGQVYWPDYYHFDTAPEVEDYQALFAGYAGQAAIGDVSPDYLSYAAITAPRVHELAGPDVRIIATLRHPVERAYSHYLQNVRRDAEFFSFEKTLDLEPRRIAGNWGFQWLYTQTGRYADKLRHWFDAFPHTKVILQDDLDQDGPAVVAGLIDYLGLPPVAPISTEKRYNTGGIPQSKLQIIEGCHDDRDGESFEDLHGEFVQPVTGTSGASTADGVYPPLQDTAVSIPPMRPETRARLDALFAPQIDQLENLLDRDLSCWKPAR